MKKKPNVLNKIFCIRISEDLYKRIVALSKKEDRSVAYIIRQAIISYLDRAEGGIND